MHIMNGTRLWTPDAAALMKSDVMTCVLYHTLDACMFVYAKIALCTLQLAC